MKVEIIASFHVFVPAGTGRDQRRDYTLGMVIDESDAPAGQTLQNWVDKGLAKAVKAASAGAKPAREVGAAV